MTTQNTNYMKSKKGLIGGIAIFLIIILVLGVWLIDYFGILEFKTGYDYCEEDCEEMGLGYMSYNVAFFSANECWCREGNETRRIY